MPANGTKPRCAAPQQVVADPRCPSAELQPILAVLQRFAQLVEQARVLDRYHRLVGEGIEQCDLLIGKRTDFTASKLNRPNCHSVAQQRNTKDSPMP